MATVDTVNRSTTVPVINALTGEEMTVWTGMRGTQKISRLIWNPAFHALYPDVPIVVLDWGPVIERIRVELESESASARKAGAKVSNFAAQLWSRLDKHLRAGVMFENVLYHPYGWGSGAKAYQTLGLTENVGLNVGFVSTVEDYARLGAAWLANGLYGGGHVAMRVKVVESGYMDPATGLYVGDGMGIMADDVFQQYRREDAEPIYLGVGAQNAQVWQAFEATPAFLDEVRKSHDEMLKVSEKVPLEMAASMADMTPYRQQLIALESKMMHHPMMSSFLKRQAKSALYTISTTLCLQGFTKIVCPAEGWWTGIDGGRFAAVRFPLDARSNFQAFKDVDESLGEKVAKIKCVVQERWTSHTMHRKGCSMIVERPWVEYDAVMSVDDFKIIAGKSIGPWRKENAGTIIDIDCWISTTQLYDPASIAFAPMDIWKSMGGDVDGDLGLFMSLDEYPEIFRQAWDWRKAMSSYKVPKSTTYDHDKLYKFLVNSMRSGIGFASNIMSATYCVQPQYRDGLASLLGESIPGMYPGEDFAREISRIGHPTAEMLEWVTNGLVKTFTDLYKTMSVDVDAKLKFLQQIQGVISKAYGGMPAYILWRRTLKDAFGAYVPRLRAELPEEWHREADKKGSPIRQSEEWRASIADEIVGATIVQIFLAKREWITKEFLRLQGGGDLYEAFRPGLLSDFENWSPRVDEVMLTRANMLVKEYMTMVSTMDFRDDNQVERMSMIIADAASAMANEPMFMGNRRLACYALWRAAHHSRSPMGGASVVFDAFPEECIAIVKDKPGMMHNPVAVIAEDETVAEFCERKGLAEADIVALNPDAKPGDVVKLPKASYTCIVAGIGYNFYEPTPSVIGPFMGCVYSVDLDDQVRNVIGTTEKLPLHHGSGLGSDVVGMIARTDLAQSLAGGGAPPVGKYLIMLVQMKDKFGKALKSYRGQFSPL